MTAGLPYVDHFRTRVLQDAFAEAEAAYWRRRAEAFENAAPRAGDFAGAATEAELDEQARRCTEAAVACRGRALTLVETPMRAVAAA